MESSSDSSFARTEGQLNQVQNEILQQGKDIEEIDKLIVLVRNTELKARS